MTEKSLCKTGLTNSLGDNLWQIYHALYECFGELNWWPADTPFEVIIGAILTQNTAWKNVVKAIDNLKEAGLLTPNGLSNVDMEKLAFLIRPSGYYRLKAQRLKAFVHYLYNECSGNVENLFHGSTWQIRDRLLRIKGVGEETADCILLYAGGRPIFVVDAYTRRILERHKLIQAKASYAEIQALFMTNLPHSTALYNAYHALLVNTGKMFCTTKSLCEKCPLNNIPTNTFHDNLS